MMALTFALGLCAFDLDGNGVDDHGVDFCVMPLATPSGVTLPVAPAEIGRLALDIPRLAPDAVLHLPDPPPKPALGG